MVAAGNGVGLGLLLEKELFVLLGISGKGTHREKQNTNHCKKERSFHVITPESWISVSSAFLIRSKVFVPFLG